MPGVIGISNIALVDVKSPGKGLFFIILRDSLVRNAREGVCEILVDICTVIRAVLPITTYLKFLGGKGISVMDSLLAELGRKKDSSLRSD
jgi:hypothetical protein